MVRKSYNSGSYVAYTYNAEGSLARLSYGDSTGELASYRFEYDSLGRLIRSAELDADGGTVQRTEHIYDGYNRLSRQSWTLGGKTYTEYYSYDDATDGSMTSFRTTAEQTLHFTYDALRRLQKTTVTDGSGTLFTVARSYYTTGGKATTRTEYFNYRMPNGSLIAGDRYVYDALGNITELREAEPASGSSARRTKVRYTYDGQNQLRTETRYTYSSNTDTTGTSVSYTYNYDTAGNLQSVQKNGATVQTYTYGDSQWRDLLTKVGGTTISYDASGNPKNWYNGTTYTGLTWKNGRQLAQITTGGRTSAYRYDADGIRTYKKVGSVAHEYRTLNGKVVYEKIGSGSTAKIMIFSYDAQGRPFAVKYSTNNGGSYITYFYALNQQGDVVKIFRPLPSRDSNGNLIGLTKAVYATYTYDAWGNILSQSGSMASANPLRYRGYYYDTETGFYYLQSRYYDPATRRFINADALASTGQGVLGYNMFAYCGNNPVQRSDAAGLNWFDDLHDFAKSAISSALHGVNNSLRAAGVDTAAIGASLLDMQKDENGIYHADVDCWQQYFGYNHLYDVAFDLGTDMNTDCFDFNYGGKDYRIWLWKGDYINLGAGAEMGIYYGGGPQWCVDTDLACSMSMKLYYQGNEIIDYSATTWWLTGFNPAYQNVMASDLTVAYTINFSNPDMLNAFMEQGGKRWAIYGQTAIYVFR